MSYSFNIRAATLAGAGPKIAKKLDEVVEAQPVHARDRDLAEATATAMLAQCAAPEDNEELSISIAGSCFGMAGQPFEGLSLSIHINMLPKTS